MRAVYLAYGLAGFFIAIMWQFPGAPTSEAIANRYATLVIATAFLLVVGCGLSEIAAAIRSRRP